MNNDDEKRQEQLIIEIRRLAGEIGSMQDSLDKGGDAENYDYQVRTGLAVAVDDILGYDPKEVVRWLGHCLIPMGIDVNDRVEALLDALSREIDAQLAERDEEEDDDAGESGE